jgi:signal transduction histidine kinase
VRAASALILRQIERLGRLVDDLLVPAGRRGEALEPRLEPVDLVTVLTETVEALRGLVEERGHQLVLALPAGPVVLRGDRDGLAQIVTNLVWNATKFTPAGGRISVTLGREGDDAVVRVRDNGIGIAPAMRDRIFRLFTRAAPPGDSGRGIGLTVVELLTLRHGGRVSVHSAGPGCGSEFEVRLPQLAGDTGGGTTDALRKTCVL